MKVAWNGGGVAPMAAFESVFRRLHRPLINRQEEKKVLIPTCITTFFPKKELNFH
jgi:hypothetical protein